MRVTTWRATSPFHTSPSCGPTDTRPRDGLRPTRPHSLDGMRIDPPPSPACATGTSPAATAAAEPPLEPPGPRVGSHGLRVAPYACGSVVGLQPELGRVGLADDHEAGAFELVEEVGAVGRGVADLLEQLVAEVERRAGELAVEVLHDHRHAGERPRRTGAAARVRARSNSGWITALISGFDGLDARDRGVDELGRR